MNTIPTLRTASELKRRAHDRPANFVCQDCKQIKPILTGITTGYGYPAKGTGGNLFRPVCFDCCGIRDRAQMMKDGRIVLYLTTPGKNAPDQGAATVSNWPASLKFSGRLRRGRHNIARVRYDVWFVGPENTSWHGVTFGDWTQLCYCRRIKS